MIEFDPNQIFALAALAQDVESNGTRQTGSAQGVLALAASLGLAKILVVPVIVWFIKEVIVYSFGRFNLIRHLHSEIELEVTALKTFLPVFREWKQNNIDCVPSILKSKMKLIKFVPDFDYAVYKASRSEMVKSLWGKEITKLHSLYRKFRDIQVWITSVVEILNDAADNFAEKQTNEFELMKRESECVISTIDALINDHTGKAIADEKFYSLHVYWIPTIFVASLVAGALWLLGIIG